MLHQPRPQPPLDFATTLMIDHPGRAMPEDEQQVLLPDNAPAEAFQGYDLDVLAYTATQQYFELAREESELDVWRRNANGPPPAAVPHRLPGARPQLYIAPLPTHEANSAVSPGLSPWTAVDLQNQQQHMMSQPHHHHQGPGSHYFTASSPTSPPPAQYAYDPIYQSNNNGGYPSSTSSNDPAMTQEEADLKRLRNTAASARFRAKKKKREQSLERAAHEKKTRLSALETRIRDLEAENRWLKDLIMERNDVRKTVARYEAELERGNEMHETNDDEECEADSKRGSGMVGRGDGNGMGVG